MKRSIITGCGRSGTTYMASTLSALGYKCNHEIIFPHNITTKRYFFNLMFHKFFGYLRWTDDIYGEAAWEAVKFDS